VERGGAGGRIGIVRAVLVISALLAVVVAAGCGTGGHAAPTTVTTPARPAAADPYKASLAYAECMRAHGVPHPNPNAQGDFHLTYAQEARMRAVPAPVREAAQRACFHTLKGLDMRPLSKEAKLRALAVLRELSRCMLARGHRMGRPVVKNLTLGRAFFGFQSAPRPGGTHLIRDEHACEKQVDLAGRIDTIIAADRSPS
jgi:hypothetical protein